MEIVKTYFPQLSPLQLSQFEKLKSIYEYWNKQINVISRKDTDFFYERHVLHSLGIAKIIDFNDNAQILDIGTGGGFPGIPLAILFPNSQFILVDSIGKKIKVVNEVVSALQLKNTMGLHNRAEQINGQFDFIVSRAVTQMPAFIPWTIGKIKTEQEHAIDNGILYLKGGHLLDEMKPVNHRYSMHPLSKFFKESFFDTKYVVHVSI
ncbi:MAG: 16S rRNA (guanine(527)-N(7))-methyltransferase RsmG [Bacteroidetes bacterium]|nr:16S rRNA (guanine(527)-N(7))-methyltransferase RsmG [Bacteroidota bacterium]